jgi:hypothetical protein
MTKKLYSWLSNGIKNKKNYILGFVMELKTTFCSRGGTFLVGNAHKDS